MLALIARSVIILLSAYALVSVFPIVHLHWNEEVACPTIGFIPACYLVLVAYAGILLSVALPLLIKSFTKAKLLFWVSWLVVSGFALMGIFGEVTGLWHCPQTESGIPKCFFSAGLALIIGVLYWTASKANDTEANNTEANNTEK